MRIRRVRQGVLLLATAAVLIGLAGRSDTRAWKPADPLETPEALKPYLDSPVPKEMYNLAEEFLAHEITEALIAEGISPLPAVEFEIVTQLRELVISPREEITIIQRTLQIGDTGPLGEDLSPERIEEIERRASYGSFSSLTSWDEEAFELTKDEEPRFSALVVRLGGVALSTPVVATHNLRVMALTIAHEWAHRYLVYAGFGYYISFGYYPPEMRMLNEITADIVSSEIASRVFRKYGWRMPEGHRNCLREELRPIRITTEQLLAEGRIEEAEAWMEGQRVLLCEQGSCPRKINQAFLALCEAYGGGAEGDNPIPGAMRQLRTRYPTLKAFLEDIRELSFFEEFLLLLEQKGIDYPEGE